MDDQQFRYAMHYFRYGAEYVEYGDDLKYLIDVAEMAEMDGSQSTGGFYEMVDGEWHEVDVSDIGEQIASRQETAYAEGKAKQRARPWRVYIFGPNNVDSCWSSHETEAEAQAAASMLPSALRARVTTETTSPMDWREKPDLEDITVRLAEVAPRSGE